MISWIDFHWLNISNSCRYYSEMCTIQWIFDSINYVACSQFPDCWYKSLMIWMTWGSTALKIQKTSCIKLWPNRKMFGDQTRSNPVWWPMFYWVAKWFQTCFNNQTFDAVQVLSNRIKQCFQTGKCLVIKQCFPFGQGLKKGTTPSHEKRLNGCVYWQ